jgi:hypothetical protein
MIFIKLDTQVVSIFADISNHPVLSQLYNKHGFCENNIYMPEACFDPETLAKLIVEGLAFRI